jgi:hypothetical protein
MVSDMLFYELVKVNDKAVHDKHYMLGLYDKLSIPVNLNTYMSVGRNRVAKYPQLVRQFFKTYYNFSTNTVADKV